jgi:phosphoesterase RecJ-like protein
MILRDIAAFIQRYDNFLITAHSRPDGDSIGTQLALSAALRQHGKQAVIVNADPFPPSYRNLPGAGDIQIAPSVSADSYQALIILECANLERTGLEGLEGLPTANIDHHPVNDYYGEINWVDPTAAAVGEMLYTLLVSMGWDVSPDIATNLYAAILTDTGSFQFSNTTAATFQTVSQLVLAGAQPSEIAEEVLLRQSEARLRLIARLLSTLEVNHGGKIAWIRMDQQMLDQTGAKLHDTEGLVNYPLNINGVQLCAFFREEGTRGYRVSLRSKGELDVGQVAQEFGGGGHRNAAGLSVSGTFDEARDAVVASLRRLLEP